jgi:hypothetical protein
METTLSNTSVPLDIPLSEWTAAMAHPNATGQQFIFGPTFDGNDSFSNDWSLNITVAAGIPLVDSSNTAFNKSQVFDGTQITLNVSALTCTTSFVSVLRVPMS